MRIRFSYAAFAWILDPTGWARLISGDMYVFGGFLLGGLESVFEMFTGG